MGRKIPGRKHHGVRDIEKQRQLKLLSLKDKINAPPSNPDDQQIPKSLSRLIELKEKVKSGEIALKRNRKPKQKFGSVGLPNTKQFKRIGLKKSREVFIQSEEDSSSSDNDDEEVLLKQMKEDESSKSNSQKNTDKLSKSQKRQRKLKERKLKKANLYADDFKNLSDEVKFGEVVHAPPSLSVPRKALSKDTPRPGKKNLLLKSIIEDAKEGEIVEQKRNKNEKVQQLGRNKVIDKKAKRKHMPHALRRQLDKQQKEVVEAYKLLKSKKYNNLKR